MDKNPMDIEVIFQQMRDQVALMNPIKATMKLVMAPYVFVIDGTGDKNLVSTDDIETNCTVKTDLETFYKMKSGKLNPVMALMEGKMNVDGSYGLAFRMRGLMS